MDKLRLLRLTLPAALLGTIIALVLRDLPNEKSTVPTFYSTHYVMGDVKAPIHPKVKNNDNDKPYWVTVTETMIWLDCF